MTFQVLNVHVCVADKEHTHCYKLQEEKQLLEGAVFKPKGTAVYIRKQTVQLQFSNINQKTSIRL